MTVFRTLHI